MKEIFEAFERIKYGVDNNSWDGNEYDDLDTIEKALKALEIIKAIGVFNVFEDVGGKYHLETMVDNVGLTKEDYDLLKEVML